MNRNNGFTLIEVLAAVAILGVSFYLLLELRQQALQSAIFTSKRLVALQVARTKMEETLAMGFPDPNVINDVLGGVNYRINIVDIGDETSLGALRRIDVEVGYDIGFGEEGRIVLSTIVSPQKIKMLPKSSASPLPATSPVGYLRKNELPEYNGLSVFMEANL